MRYILTSKTTGKDHLVNEATFQKMSKHHAFHRKYTVEKIADRKEVPKPQELKIPIELKEPIVDKRKKRVEEPKTESND